MVADFENIGMIEFLTRFQTEGQCYEYLSKIKWNGEAVSPFDPVSKVYRCADFKYKCKTTGKYFNARTGTIFDNTKLPLRSWFYLIYQLAISKKNVSSHQVGRNLDITQKTAWGIGMKIRNQLAEDHIIKLSGIVEIDEVFVSKGKLNRWTRWGGITTRKAPILGLIERGGKVVIVPIPNRSREEILKIIKLHVLPGSTIYTDGWVSYRKLTDLYSHDYVEHSTREYVRGGVHTNTIENVWSFLKKSIRNAHHSVSEKHIAAYCNEVAFRFNYRDLTFTERFNEILHRCLNI